MASRDFERPGPPKGWDLFFKALPPLTVALILIWFAFSSFFTLEPNERAAVLRFGKRHDIAEPGLHFKIPLVDRVLKVSIEEHRIRLPVDLYDAGRSESDELETLMLTGDLNTAAVEWTVNWKVVDPEAFLFRFDTANQDDDGDGEPDEVASQVIGSVARTVMNRLVGDYSIDEVLTDQRASIAHLCLEGTQKILDAYDCGLAISAMQMQRVTPPNAVKPSFDKVVSSVQARDRLVSEAENTRNQLLPKAKAEKDKAIREAEGYASRRRAEANGEIKALLAKYNAYLLAPQATRDRLYLEAMQEILQSVESKTIVDSDIDQMFPLLNLTREAKP